MAEKKVKASGEELLKIEHQLARGDGSTYDRHLHEAAVVVIPGDSLDKPATVEAMNASPGWDEVSIGEERVRELGDDAALLTYVFRGRRGGIATRRCSPAPMSGTAMAAGSSPSISRRPSRRQPR